MELPAPGRTAPAPDTASALIAEAAASADGRLTVVALGPWTNLADAIRADPSAAGRIREIHAMLGAIDAPGNVDLGDTRPEDRVEWNAGADPDAVAAVLASDVPVTLVPLDATDAVPLTADLVETTAGVGAGTGADLVSQVYLRDPAIASSGQSLWDSLTALLLTDRELGAWSDARVTVVTTGAGAGALQRSDPGRPISFATSADAARVMPAWVAALTRTKVRIGPDGRFLP
jgi:inosine-uridine nucleoside N-ribohydrolase